MGGTQAVDLVRKLKAWASMSVQWDGTGGG